MGRVRPNRSNVESYAWLIVFINHIIHRMLNLNEGQTPINVKLKIYLIHSEGGHFEPLWFSIDKPHYSLTPLTQKHSQFERLKDLNL